MRVLVVDDNRLIRVGLRVSLEGLEGIDEVLEAENGLQAVEVARTNPVDVVLLDVRMPVLDGLGALPELVSIATVLMLTNTDDLDVVGSAMRAGASGYILHGQLEPEGIRDAMRACLAGGNFTAGLSPWELVHPARPPAASGHRALLSPREQQIMDHVATGASNGQIAATLYVSEKTVKNHINSIFAKLAVASRAQAVAMWLGGGPRDPVPD